MNPKNWTKSALKLFFMASSSLITFSIVLPATEAFAQHYTVHELTDDEIIGSELMDADSGLSAKLAPSTSASVGLSAALATPTPFGSSILPPLNPNDPPPIVPVKPGGEKPGPPPPVNPLPVPNGSATPFPTPIDPGGDLPTTGNAKIDVIVAIGNKIWNFILSAKPNATYNVLKASVVPEGIKSWTQLAGWSRPVNKIYRVTFYNMFGQEAGGFDYKINFIYGGRYLGKGKFIGEISFVPTNVRLKTDRQLNVKAQVLDPVNFGSEEDPVAGIHLIITWESPTTPRYQMNSAEYYMYGTGEIQDLNN
jgi:hypothetical protein